VLGEGSLRRHWQNEYRVILLGQFEENEWSGAGFVHLSLRFKYSKTEVMLSSLSPWGEDMDFSYDFSAN